MRVLGQELTIRGGIHAVVDITYIDTRFAASENRLKGLAMSQPPTNYPLPNWLYVLNVNPLTTLLVLVHCLLNN